MSKGDDVKKNLIEVSAKLFLQNGYYNTGINDILLKAAVSKGSFYFYFSSKKELAIEVSKYYCNILINKWLKPLSNNNWNVFVNKISSDIKYSIAQGDYFGCPIAVLGTEIAFIEKDLSELYAQAIKKLISVFSNSLEISGIKKEDAYNIAQKAFDIYEGQILYYRITKDKSAFDFLEKYLLELCPNK